ncbi:DUF134 domain-containing protein [Sulfurovum mangrovi]|uniref:DUF134 domain-containing protein n=1 Tax=Sulfurovum mangrovi TaxID=2893889 RepID=UPI001E572078|nr:DUF134 domain-containing protein [Sulfurovum mangrovi]UFH60222.1 DUF134 domain-containing protein [Sulfurovum mangrovi]
MKNRNITFKPKSLLFGPLTHKAKEMIQMSDDELEALYLADFRGLYQEECAKQLGVSRPTFAKIIKSARKKVTEMLMYGKGIELLQEKRNFVLVYPTNDRVTIHPYFLTAKLFAFAKIEEDSIVSISYIDNPVYQALHAKGITIVDDDSAKGMAAGRIIPPLLKKGNMLVVKSLGEGMKRNIEGIGLNIEYSDLSDIDTVLESLI